MLRSAATTSLLGEADAAVVGWDGHDAAVSRVLELVERKGIPVHALGVPQKKSRKVCRERISELPRCGLPD